MGNHHARFLGERAAARPLSYPTRDPRAHVISADNIDHNNIDRNIDRHRQSYIVLHHDG